MNILAGFSIVFLIVFLVLIIHPSEKDIEELAENRKEKSLKAEATERKKGKLSRLFSNTDRMLKVTNQGGIYRLVFISLILGLIGFFIAYIIGNYILIPVLIIVGFVIPFFLTKIHYTNYSKLVLDELEPTLSLITTSYERNNNILQSFEENLPYIQEPIKPAFEEFVHRLKHIDANMPNAIDVLKTRIDHSVFVEWCDALKACTNNGTLKYTLQPIVNKLTEIKIVSGELRNILFASLRTFYVMLVLTIILTGLALFVFPTILDIQLPKIVIDLILAIDIAVMSFSTMKVYVETKTINTDV